MLNQVQKPKNVYKEKCRFSFSVSSTRYDVFNEQVC